MTNYPCYEDLSISKRLLSVARNEKYNNVLFIKIIIIFKKKKKKKKKEKK